GPGPLPRFRLIYKTSNQPGRRRLAEAIQAALAQVGIALEVRTYEWGTLFADVRSGNFQLCALAWVGIGDPDLDYLALHSTMHPPAGSTRAWMEAGEAARAPAGPPEEGEAERESAHAACGGSRAGVGLGASEQRSARSARAPDGPPEEGEAERESARAGRRGPGASEERS